MIQHETLAGTSIDTAAREMIAKANKADEPVETVFNGVHVVAYPNDNVSAVCYRYTRVMSRRREEHEANLDRVRAAAPKLLEACKEAEAVIAQVAAYRGSGVTVAEKSVLAALRAAIAEAEGTKQ